MAADVDGGNTFWRLSKLNCAADASLSCYVLASMATVSCYALAWWITCAAEATASCCGAREKERDRLERVML